MIEWMRHCQTLSHIPFLTAVLANLSLISSQRAKDCRNVWTPSELQHAMPVLHVGNREGFQKE